MPRPEPRSVPRAGPGPDTAGAAPDPNNVAIHRILHTSCGGLPPGRPRRAAPQRRRRSRSPQTGPAPLQSRAEPSRTGPAAGNRGPGEPRPSPAPAARPLPVTASAAEPAAPPRAPRRPPPPSAASSSQPAAAPAAGRSSPGRSGPGRSSPSRSRQGGSGRAPGARSPLIGTAAAAERRQERRDGRTERGAGTPRCAAAALAAQPAPARPGPAPRRLPALPAGPRRPPHVTAP